MSSGASLPRSLRVRKRKDFLFLQRVGGRASSAQLTAIYRAVHGRHGRVGLTVTKKVGNAPARNLMKRRLRHILRTNKSWWARGDVIVLVRPGAVDLSFVELGRQLEIAIADAQRRAASQRGPRKRRRKK